MKKGTIARIFPLFLLLLVPLFVGGCPAGNYMGYYEGGYDDPYGNQGPPFVYDTVIDLYLRVLDPLGYAVPGCDVEVNVAGRRYNSHIETSGQFHPINNAFPGEWANFNEAYEVDVQLYQGQRFKFDVKISRWGYVTEYRHYDIPSIDTDSIYLFFDEVTMYH